MKTLTFIFAVFLPLSLPAHDFWIFQSGNECRIYGGHSFPETEMAPGKNIVARAFIYEKEEVREISLQRGERFLFATGIEKKSLLAFSLERGGRTVYCGFYIPHGLALSSFLIEEEDVQRVCGRRFSISLSPYPPQSGRETKMGFSAETHGPFLFYSEKGEKKTLIPDRAGTITFKVPQEGLYLLVGEQAGMSFSIVLEVK